LTLFCCFFFEAFKKKLTFEANIDLEWSWDIQPESWKRAMTPVCQEKFGSNQKVIEYYFKNAHKLTDIGYEMLETCKKIKTLACFAEIESRLELIEQF
jgi:hypothetical protein